MIAEQRWSVSYSDELVARIEDAGYSLGKGTMRRTSVYRMAVDEASAYAAARAWVFQKYGLNAAPDELQNAHAWNGVL